MELSLCELCMLRGECLRTDLLINEAVRKRPYDNVAAYLRERLAKFRDEQFLTVCFVDWMISTKPYKEPKEKAGDFILTKRNVVEQKLTLMWQCWAHEIWGVHFRSEISCGLEMDLTTHIKHYAQPCLWTLVEHPYTRDQLRTWIHVYSCPPFVCKESGDSSLQGTVTHTTLAPPFALLEWRFAGFCIIDTVFTYQILKLICRQCAVLTEKTDLKRCQMWLWRGPDIHFLKELSKREESVLLIS